MRRRELGHVALGTGLALALACGDDGAPVGTMPDPLAGAQEQVSAGTVAGSGVQAQGGSAAAAGAAGAPRAAGAGAAGTGANAGTGAVMVVDPPPVWGRWSSFGGDLAHSRSGQGESRITPDNIEQLKPAFRIEAPGVTATPAFYDGVVYWADWGGIVHATDILDQSELWRVDHSQAGGGYTGSPAVTERMVYVANRNGLLSALDRLTGEEVWRATLDAGPHTHIWSSPIVVEQDNVLIIGVGGIGTRDNGRALPRSQIETFFGSVQGFDAQTGSPLWSFETSEGYGAGVSVWSSAAVDPTRKLAFIGTGNNYYRPVSPYSDALLAIDYQSGELKWHQQFTVNDAWTVGTTLGGGVDGDVGAAPNLFSIGERAVVGVGDKPGRYHVLDRDTGEEVWSQRLTRGGFQGGVMAPAAYADGVVYVISNNSYTSSTVFALDVAAGGDVIWSKDLPATTFGGPAVGNGVLFAGDQEGNIRAYATESGEQLWQSRTAEGRGGGFTLVDGLLITGHGFHFSESRREPLDGGLVTYSLSGMLNEPEPGSQTATDCDPNFVGSATPTFTDIYQEVICGTGCRACHGPTKQGALGLHPRQVAYDSLVSVGAAGEACLESGRMLVEPGNPEGSLLVQKLEATPGLCGDAMPPGDPTNSPVTADMRARVRAWIAAGAAND